MKISVPKYEAIVIGASWGGLDAIIKILKGLPKNFKLPIIVVLHRLKNFKSELEQIIEHRISLKVKEIEEKDPILPGWVYLAPPDYHVLIEDNKTFSLCISKARHFSRPSIDITFESAAEVFKGKIIGIILTGANKDGSDGLRLIGENGGATLIQDPKEAEIDVMPKSAIKSVKFPVILNLKEIRDFIIRNES